MKSVVTKLGKSLGLAGALVTISDLMQPIAPLSAYVLAVSGISLVILLIAKHIGRVWNETLSISAYFASGIFVLSSFLFFYQGKIDVNNIGLMASSIPELSRFQESLGMVGESIERIDKSVSSIDYKMDNVKKESSDDPQKELANLGVPWTDNAYAQALLRSDIKVIDLFLRAGWNPKSGYDNGSAIGNYIWLGDMSDSSKVNKVIKMMLDHGISFREPVSRFRGVEAQDLVSAAIRSCNLVFLQAALANGGKLTSTTSVGTPYIGAAPDGPLAAKCENDRVTILSMIEKGYD